MTLTVTLRDLRKKWSASKRCWQTSSICSIKSALVAIHLRAVGFPTMSGSGSGTANSIGIRWVSIPAEAKDKSHLWEVEYQGIARKMPFLIEEWLLISLAMSRQCRQRTFQPDLKRISTRVSTSPITNFAKTSVKFTTKSLLTKFTSKKSNLQTLQSKTVTFQGRKCRTKCTLSLSRSSTKKRKSKKWTQRTFWTILTKRLLGKRLLSLTRRKNKVQMRMQRSPFSLEDSLSTSLDLGKRSLLLARSFKILLPGPSKKLSKKVKELRFLRQSMVFQIMISHSKPSSFKMRHLKVN